MNELFAGYANYASTKTVLIESLVAGNYQVSDAQSPWTMDLTLTFTLTVTLPYTVTLTV